ncbi:MAG: ribosome-associated translation inhibitor RaiA [Oscillospiraceae bacterium]|nr:ribosome-associated translation inhibitor RaiA [Oscillospiraceae bacterium]
MKMNVKVTAKKMQVDGLIEYAEARLRKLERFFGEDFDAKITASSQRGMVTLELTVKHDNLIFRAEQSAQNKNDALDACVDRIIRQIRKNKTRIEKRLQSTAFNNGFGDDVEEQADYEVIRRKQFILRPMSVEEAILQMNMLGHSFFMFKNGETGETNVVYKRDDGNYAVMEPGYD